MPYQKEQLNFKIMGAPLQKAILELNGEVKTMARDVNLEGPKEIDSNTMSLE